MKSSYADPLDSEIYDADLALKAALTQRLRGSSSGGSPWGNAIRGIGDTLINSMDRRAAEEKVAQILAQKRAESEAALEGQPDDVRKLFKLDRGAGVKAIEEERTRRREREEYEAIGKVGDGGIDFSSMSAEDLMKLKRHPNKRIAGQAEDALKFYYDPQDPSKSVRRSPGGGMSLIPGALEALDAKAAQEREGAASLDLVEVPMGDGTTKRMTRLQAAQMLGGGSTQRPFSPPEGGLGGRVPAPSESRIRPGSEGPGGVGGPLAGAVSAFTAAGEDKRTQILLAELAQERDPAVRAEIQKELDFDKRRPVRTMSAPSGPAPAFGISDPAGLKFKEEAATSGRKQMEKLQEVKVSTEQGLATLDRLSELNQSGQIIGGPFAKTKLSALRAIQNVTGAEVGGVPETEEYLKETLSQLKDQLKAFGSGTGISNLDLLTAERMLAQPANTQEGRQRIIEFMKTLSQTAQKNTLSQEQYFVNNHTLDGWQPKRYDPEGNIIEGSQMKNTFPSGPKLNMKDPVIQEQVRENTLPNAMKARYGAIMKDLPGFYSGAAKGLVPDEAMGMLGIGPVQGDAQTSGQVFSQTSATLMSLAVPIAKATGLTVAAVKSMLQTSAGKIALRGLMGGTGLGAGGAAIYGLTKGD